MRPALAILSTKNLIHNIDSIKKMASNSQFIAMVKANAYGHGIRSVALRIKDHVDIFGVASIDEALILRKIGIKNEIVLIEGIFSKEELEIASHENFQVVIHDDAQLQWLENASDLLNKLTVWMKIDTGMGRLGFNIENEKKLHNVKKKYDILSKNKFLKDELRLMSHFACADDKNHDLNQIQISRFDNFCSLLSDKNIIKSFCNSAGIINFPQCHYNFVRSGASLYGFSPINDSMAFDFNLKPVMTLKAKIITTKFVSKGERVGYGGLFLCEEDKKIAIISMGYGDGYSRAIKGAPVIINGKVFYTIGRISMDMAAIDITGAYDIKNNDDVILWGEDLPIEEVTKYCNNSQYDLLTGVQMRVKFNWV